MTDYVERVKKLIALAASDNPEEARNAAHLACRLIREHKMQVIGARDVPRSRVHFEPDPGAHAHRSPLDDLHDMMSELFKDVPFYTHTDHFRSPQQREWEREQLRRQAEEQEARNRAAEQYDEKRRAERKEDPTTKVPYPKGDRRR